MVPMVDAPLDPADAAALRRVRAICLAFAGVEEAELQDRPLFRVGRRRFALFNGAGSPPRARWSSAGRSLHFLSDPLDIDALGQDARFGPSPHHGHRGWMALHLDEPVDWDEVAELCQDAYRAVAPRRLVALLDEEP